MRCNLSGFILKRGVYLSGITYYESGRIMSVIEQFEVTYESLEITVQDILTLLGYKTSNTPEPVLSEINDLVDKVPDHVKPQGGYVYFPDYELKVNDESFTLNDKQFTTEGIIASQLKGSKRLAVLVSSAGEGISDLSKELIEKGEFLKGYVADTIGSIVAEKAADYVEKNLEDKVSESGMKISNRLSPGYCGWDVAEQHRLFSLLPDDFCGVTLTESALMVPIKSISAVIGVGEDVVKRSYPCHECTREDCWKKRTLTPQPPFHTRTL